MSLYSCWIAEAIVRVKDTAPAGFFNQQLVLVTNDDQHITAGSVARPRNKIFVRRRWALARALDRVALVPDLADRCLDRCPRNDRF